MVEPGYIECPCCAGAIIVGATKCRHCKTENITATSDNKVTQTVIEGTSGIGSSAVVEELKEVASTDVCNSKGETTASLIREAGLQVQNQSKQNTQVNDGSQSLKSMMGSFYGGNIEPTSGPIVENAKVVKVKSNESVIKMLKAPIEPLDDNSFNILIFSGIGLAVLGVIMLFVVVWVGLIIIASGGGLIVVWANNEEARKEDHRMGKNSAIRKAHGAITNAEINKIIPGKRKTVSVIKGLKPLDDYLDRKNINHKLCYIWIWKENDELLFTYAFTEKNNRHMSLFYLDSEGEIKNKILDGSGDRLPIFKISENDILFFSREGDFYIESGVHGSGGGSDYGRALVGGALFGGAGAIVASRKDISINSTTRKIDERKTILYYKQNDVLLEAHFASKDYENFQELIPYKDASVVDRMNRLTADKTSGSKQETQNKLKSENQEFGNAEDIYTKIEKMGELLKKGYITKEEFDAKKRQLLEMI